MKQHASESNEDVEDNMGSKIQVGSIVMPSAGTINMPPLHRDVHGGWSTLFNLHTSNTQMGIFLCVGYERYNADSSVLHLLSPTSRIINLYAHEVTVVC